MQPQQNLPAFKTVLLQLRDATALFLLKLGLAAILLLSDKLLLWAVGQVFVPGSQSYNGVEVLVNVAFAGAAVSVSFIGAIFFVYEVAMASYDHARRWRNDRKGS